MATLEQKLQQYIKEGNTSMVQSVMNQVAGGKDGGGVGARIYNTANSYMTSLGTTKPTAPTATIPTYSYASNSAAGPATLPQYQTAMNTNTPVYIPPSMPSKPQTTWSFNDGVAAYPNEGRWTTSPKITYGGQTFSFGTPQEVLSKMDEIRGAGQANSLASNNFDAMYKYYSDIARDWKSPQATVPTAMDLGYNIPVTNYEKQTGLPQSTVQGQNGQQSTNNSFLDMLQLLKDKYLSNQQQVPSYQSPYENNINELYKALTNLVSNPQQYNPGTDQGLKIAQEDAIKTARRDLGRRGMIGSNSGIYGQQGEIQAGQRLIPQYQQMFQQNEQQKLNNIYNQLSALQGIENRSYGQYRDKVGDINNQNKTNLNNILSIAELTNLINNANIAKTNQTEKQLSQFGYATNPMTNTVQQTPEAQDAQTVRYEASITGLGDNFDYQSEINRINKKVATGDTSESWKLGPLNRQRDAKIQTQIAGLTKYSNDYQAEINRREAIQNATGSTDPLLPYLRVLRAQKLKTMSDAQLSQQDKAIKNALDIWERYGTATKAIATILGIPEGAQTSDYLQTMYDINKPYYKEGSGSDGKMTTAEKNSQYANDVDVYQSYPVAQAQQLLIDHQDLLIEKYGSAGYRRFWDDVLAKGINAGTAKRYVDYFKNPKNDSSNIFDQVDAFLKTN